MLKSILQPTLSSILKSVLGDSGGGGTTPPPFDYDSNTYWWDFRSTQANNVVNTIGDDTMAFTYEARAGNPYKGLEQANKSLQPLIKTVGIDFNLSTNRFLRVSNASGLCNATNGWYCAFNFKPASAATGMTILRISGASTSSSASRGLLTLVGNSTTPQLRVDLANNDGTTLTRLGFTNTSQIPNTSTNLWSTVEVEVNISSGTAVLRIWINGVLQTLGGIATPAHTTTFLATNPNHILIGNSFFTGIATGSFDGEIQQMIFQNGVPSSNIRSSISSYLIGIKP